jgi:hypothetical protein
VNNPVENVKKCGVPREYFSTGLPTPPPNYEYSMYKPTINRGLAELRRLDARKELPRESMGFCASSLLTACKGRCKMECQRKRKM